ncbi:hypothetical protein ACN23B_14475 [Anabaena sp. FACHB-709]|uniref:Uncharacterized protein n=2 Tax=Nostocaceae TaxID=1162 RepID=A0A1Z4KHU5_ANAVA|nr:MULTISPECIES: hypothetical protein [Nostocaceae]BAY68517.1 hypothetical protein NIES23_13030 [Trichormus variabilis NIES-23]HBW32622.1 hypothetical protein [Nostoc sp. UBA8866]MBD2171676.1 hypothetical protein [Anabaena cylindrica FACHB-318]MBD2264195.1 hypothetical protein [Anabaena sp. FACHB-709]MBD2273538.1 hypothetical protein [Nostoc sp. PCC 7120 = FACHB-418]
MYRLNQRAWKLLLAEVEKCSGNDQVSKIEREIVNKRLEKLRSEKGSPAQIDELRDTVVDIYPQFSEKILKQAAKANQAPGIFTKIKWTVILVGSSAGIVWVVNLPYPMIRWPVARTLPILLLPSYMSMDYHYRGVIQNLEQADQLINKATSSSDIEEGGKKVKEAQKHLDNLPVWFLGYYPQAYCSLFGCSWRFTLDEFEAARQRTARISAVVFQDKNALTPLNQGELAIELAKKQYEQATNSKDREQAIASWQAGIDQLEEIPAQTLAAKTAKAKLRAYTRDFENARIGSFIVAAQEFDLAAEKIKQTQPQTASELWQQAMNRINQVPLENPRYLEAQKLLAIYQGKIQGIVDPKSGKLIEGAKQFALAAAQASQNPPHTETQWRQIAKLWSTAIEQLENVRVEEPGYVEAQKLLATYQTNLGIIETRLQAETESQSSLKQANEQIQSLIAAPPSDPQRFQGQIQGIINQLNTIKPGTTAYPEGQRLLALAQKRLKQ